MSDSTAVTSADPRISRRTRAEQHLAAGDSQPADKWDHARSLGRMTVPPRAAGYLILRSPVTRAAAVRVISRGDYYSVLAAVCGASVHCMALPPGDPETNAEFIREHPALGWPRPRWRLQWPVLRMRSGERLIADGDYRDQEEALAEGAAEGIAGALAEAGQ
jgi:hypothetical protein